MGHKEKGRKRQKLDKSNALSTLNVQGVNLLEDDNLKDDEELHLENLLFGKPIPRTRDNEVQSDLDDEEPSRMEHMMDSDLFFVDDTVPQLAASDDEPDLHIASDSDSVESNEPPEPVVPTKRLGKKRAAAWHDPADDSLKVSLTAHAQLRKLRDTLEEDEVGGKDYESRLRRQFEKLNPTPQWAVNARTKTKRRRSTSTLADGDNEAIDRVGDLLNDGGGLLDRREDVGGLPSGNITIERLRDANQSARAQGAIHSLAFHPNPKVPMLFTAGSDRRLRIFNIDGHTNPHLQTVHTPSLPLTNASFHPTGSSILLTGPRPFYFSYDLQTGHTSRSKVKSSDQNANADLSLEICQFSPSGDMLAVAGRRGYVHILDWTKGGGQQVVASLKSNNVVKSMWWGCEGREVWTLGNDSDVYQWDVGTRRCVNRWKDDGGYGAQLLAADPTGSYLASGSTSGFVNLYDTKNATGGKRPKLLKSFGNLTTPITSLVFNSDGQMACMASDSKKNQLRLVHIPTLTAFANWPTSGTPLGMVKDVAFSPSNRYISVGNSRGQALLYSLRHYSNT